MNVEMRSDNAVKKVNDPETIALTFIKVIYWYFRNVRSEKDFKEIVDFAVHNDAKYFRQLLNDRAYIDSNKLSAFIK